MYAGIISPLDVIDRTAVLGIVGSVVVVIIRTHEPNSEFPVPGLLSPVGIGVVTKILVESGGNVKETAVGNGVLVVVTIVEGIDLPSQTSSARSVVPALVLCVEDSLCHGKPRRLTIGEIRKLVFGGG